VDDMVIKTQNSDTLITDLEETFASLRDTRGSSTPTSVSSACHQGSYSASSSFITVSRPIPRRSPPSPT
jgi:hypothetical protein